MHSIAKPFMRWLFDIRLEVQYLLQFYGHRLHVREPDVIVSMTSYPARIRGAWVSLESLFRQSYRSFKIVLVLAEPQFPGRKLPLMIRLMIGKGLEILWVEEDNKSWDHLWPAYSSYPGLPVISVDDDKVFPPDLVGRLLEASWKHPGAIVGARGWEMKAINNHLRFGEGWIRAIPGTQSDLLFIPPGNGSLYPAGSLPSLAGDVDLMREICPRADDVWYWAMARLAGTRSVCLGLEAHRKSRRQSKTVALADEDPGPGEFESVLREFGLRALGLDQLVQME